MWGYWGGTGGWLGSIGMVLVWVLVIGGVVALVRSYGLGPSSAPDRAQEIARERFARGELSPSEFEDLQRGLGTR